MTLANEKHGSLYIMRHGKTDWNEKHKIQGRTDIPLNDEGRKMAAAAAEEYKDIHFDICFCSPLIRAKETAQIFLSARNIPIIYDDRIMEMCFGTYEGIENSFEIPDCPINVLFKARTSARPYGTQDRLTLHHPERGYGRGGRNAEHGIYGQH